MNFSRRCFDLRTWRQIINRESFPRKREKIAALFAKRVFEQYSLVIEYLLLNLFSSEWFRLCQRRIMWAGSPNLSLSLPVLIGERLDLLFDCDFLRLGIFAA